MMFDRELALEALSAVLNANVTSTQTQSHHVFTAASAAAAPQQQQQLSIKQFIPSLLDADESSQVSRQCFFHIQGILQGGPQAASFPSVTQKDTVRAKTFIIDENEFFAPEFNYDFTNLQDTETYYRGGEVYERPCGWFRYGLKVLNKYGDNTWLGTSYRSTQSVPGEWPVSFHGTSKEGAEGIIDGYYKPGPGQAYGRGIYSTPYVAEAVHYAKTFTSNKNGKKYKVILQNRINPQYRLKYNNDKYWLIPVPSGLSNEQERVMVERAIRPYGLLLKQV
ncbi:uncharacterized protein LOC113166290 [Anabas testudineus]|uniref:uncharacterized protein LOC113166290 n=1 Tax=Anabas testudineus TaxID=64144 RepID=UPI000E46081F|nr:uncharacterized protein LOC113166290 [Anabas testudineus]